jgi:hypothetical protein
MMNRILSLGFLVWVLVAPFSFAEGLHTDTKTIPYVTETEAPKGSPTNPCTVTRPNVKPPVSIPAVPPAIDKDTDTKFPNKTKTTERRKDGPGSCFGSLQLIDDEYFMTGSEIVCKLDISKIGVENMNRIVREYNKNSGDSFQINGTLKFLGGNTYRLEIPAEAAMPDFHWGGWMVY